MSTKLEKINQTKLLELVLSYTETFLTCKHDEASLNQQIQRVVALGHPALSPHEEKHCLYLIG